MKYAKYKDSGIEWIGKIPEHWGLIKLGRLFDHIRTGLNPRDNFSLGQGDNFYVTIKNIKNGQVILDDLCDNIDDEALGIIQSRSNLRKGDILFPSIGVDNLSYMLKEDPLNWNINESIFAITPNNRLIVNEYLLWLLNSSLVAEQLEVFSTGSTFRSIKQNQLNRILVAIPNKIGEQQKIISYLNDKTTKIDAIIKSLEEQQDKLEQYKRELISETVTKGLKKNVSMKDSGVDWIGEIPEHWEIEKIKWNFEIVKRQDGREDRPVLSITQKGIKIKDIEKNDGQMAESYENYQLVEIGDYAMNSMDLLTGWIDCSKDEGVTSPDYRVFRLKKPGESNRHYFNYLFQMCYTRRIFYRLGQGVSNLGRWRLQREPFLNMMIPIPPKEEQDQIASYIKVKDIQIGKIKKQIELQIEELKDYRKIIIYDAVTGKKKVFGGED